MYIYIYVCVCIYTCVYINILYTAGDLNLPATQRLISWNSRAGAKADRSQSSQNSSGKIHIKRQRRFEHAAVMEPF